MKKKQSKKGRMYLILREDLSYKYIQGAHALAEFSLSHQETFAKWDNKWLICLSVFNGIALRELYMKFVSYTLRKSRHKIMHFSAFFEPDLDGQITAICFYYNTKFDRFIKKLHLATK